MKNTYFSRMIISIVVLFFLFILIMNNSKFYNIPVAKIVDISDRNTKQTLTLELKNGSDAGKIIKFDNIYDEARAYDERYFKYDYVFLNDDYSEIIGVKRDHWIAGIFLLLLATLITVCGIKGLLTSICLLGNILLFIGIILMNIRGFDILYLTIAGAAVFTFFVLLVTYGISYKTLLSYISTILTTMLLSAVVMFIIWNSDIDYDFLHFLPEPFTRTDANHFFLSQMIIGCLGAVTDVSVTIAAAGIELIEKSPGIGFRSMLKSINEIADDITGTMISVVLLTNIAPTIPIFLISISNEISFRTVVSHDAYFYIVRSLSGMISIIAAILVSVFIVSLVMKKELNHD